MVTIRISVETQDGEIIVSRNAWDGKIHTAIKDENPISRDLLLECLDKIEDELRKK